MMFTDSQHSATAMLWTLNILQLPQIGRGDVAAHEVARFRLRERRLRGLADPAGQAARAAGVEHAPAGRGSGARDLALEDDPPASGSVQAPPPGPPRPGGPADRP